MEEYCLNSSTVADWGMFCRETMLVFLAGCSEKLGSRNKIIELTKASSVGESTIGDTLLRVSGCLVVLNESPAEHFLFPYRTEPLTPCGHYK